MVDRLVIFVVSEQHVVRPRVPMIYDVELVVFPFQRLDFLVKYLVGEFLNFLRIPKAISTGVTMNVISTV